MATASSFRSFRLIVVFGLLVCAACDGGVVDSGGVVASVSVVPETETATVGGTVQLRAVLRDADGNEISGREVFWSSSDPDVAEVSGGRVTAKKAGSAQIAASAEGKSGFGTVQVRPPSPASVEVTPARATLTALSRTVDFDATPRNSEGDPITGRNVTWTSSEPGVAEISSSGVATAVGDGVTTITAEVDGATGTATLTVAREIEQVTVTPSAAALQPGETRQLTATAEDAEGHPIPGVEFSWSSSNTLVAGVSSNGEVQARTPGQATITASADDKSGTATITVGSDSEAPVASVEVEPPATSILVGDQVQLTATLRDINDNILAGREIEWESSDADVASVDDNGLVTGNALGITTITATSEGKSDEATIGVVAGEADEVERIDGNDQVGTVGQYLPDSLVVRVIDDRGNPIAGVLVEWDADLGSGSFSDDAVLTDGEGLARVRWRLGTKPGEQKATAAVEDVDEVEFEATARVGAVSSVTVSPSTATVRSIDATQQFTATARDQYSNIVSGRSFTWSSNNPSVASVSGGLATAQGNGDATITATTGGVDGDATLTVDQQVASVAVTPVDVDLESGSDTTLTATATDANGHDVAGATFAWTSSDSNVASVDDSGMVTGHVVGDADITATSEDQSGKADVRVIPGPPASMDSVSGSGQTGTAGQPLADPLIVKVTDAAGNAVQGVNVSWEPEAGHGSADPDTSFTDPSGQAETHWTLGATTVGDQRLTASLVDHPEVNGVEFTATANAGAPTSMQTTGGDDQEGLIGMPLPDSLEVELRDEFNNPVPGQTVAWSGDGVFSPGESPTDDEGRARAQWTLLVPNCNEAEASSAGLEENFTAAGKLTAEDDAEGCDDEDDDDQDDDDDDDEGKGKGKG